MENKLNAKDLIQVGIFAAIYFVLFFISGMTGFVPIFAVLFPIVLALLGGIPMILFLTKTKKFGMVTIMGIIMGLIAFAIGSGWPSLPVAVVFGLLADLIYRAGQYKSWKHMLLCYCVFSLWVIGSMLPMWIMKDAFFAGVSISQGAAYADAVSALITGWMLIIVVITTFLAAVIGAYLGRGVLKKHFKRAGIV